jgi:hypothetical protein
MSEQPRGCLFMASRISAVVLATLFVLSLPLVMLAFNLERIAFSPGTYKQALNQMGFYDRLPSLAAAQAADSIASDPTQNPALANLSRTDLQAIITQLIPQGWAQQQTETAIDQFFTWLNTDQPQLRLVISMTAVKEQVAGPEGTSALLKVLSSWPECGPSEIAAVALATQSGDLTQMPLCKPPDDLMPEVTPLVGGLSGEAAASIPDTVDLAAPDGASPGITPAGDPRPQLRQIRAVALFSPIFPALLLLGVAALAARSWRDLTRWWGIPLMIGAVLGGLAALFMLPVQNMVTQALAGQGAALPASFEDVASRLLGYVFQTAGWWIGGEAAAIGGAGFLLFISGFLGGKPKPLDEPPQT